MPEILPLQKCCQTSAGFLKENRAPDRLTQIKGFFCLQASLIDQFANEQGHLSLLCVNEVPRYLLSRIERFSFKCRKVIGFAFATLHDWLKKIEEIFHPIRSKTKTNRDSLARVFSQAFSRALRQLPVITSSFDWFTVMYVFFVIG